jgi:hypothetical protein
MHCSGNPLLCPSVHGRPLSCTSYPISVPWPLPMSTPTLPLEMGNLTGDQVCACLPLAAGRIGANWLGFNQDEISTHSIRLGSAMAMYLADVPAFTIMLISCWSSNAFHYYICCQAQEFSAGISSKILLTDKCFAVSRITPEDPPVSSNINTLSGWGLNIGLTAQNRAMPPHFSLH